ncbi:MAG: hypothetical protein HC910_19625 [Spirulinaceae cyanobacterium SM2_1_0]|nr:hypothetical protein [Spirulinaceae cyanobacterium SM2_1_0]
MKSINSTFPPTTLTAIAPRRRTPRQSFIRAVLTRLVKAVLAATIKAHEPRIRLTRDAQGQPLWRVFDPVSRTHASFARERDVRVWLEQRYYRS